MAATSYRPSESDRRPLASRKWRLSVALAGWLAGRGVRANAISLMGMGAGMLAGTALALTDRVAIPSLAWIAAAALVQLRLLANLLDGMVAIQSAQASRLGELYNEVPDRVSDAATLVGLGYAAGGSAWLGFVAAILAIFVAYVRAAVRVAGGPQDYCGPMAKQHRMFLVTLTALTAAVVPRRWQAQLSGAGWGLPAIALGVISAGCLITAARRLSRAARALMARTS
ncbi:MAG: CDP-alcohol phosphatidyltransferase family protein [Isosphaeraceae bacterium]